MALTREEYEASRKGALQNIVAVLQRNPLYYRHFGVYWFRLKQMLKDAGFGRQHLPILGDYTDESLLHRFDGMADDVFFREACKDQALNLRFNHMSSWQVDPEDGQSVHIFDEDLGR